MTKFLFKLFNPNYRLKLNYRIGFKFKRKKSTFYKLLLAYLKYKQTTKYASQISYKAYLDPTVFFPHPLGIVIGDNVVIKKNVWIWQNVTLGSHGKKDKKMEYPTIEENVRIYSGAVIIGNVTIGANAIIGANAVVTKDVPANCTAVGIPARIIEKK